MTQDQLLADRATLTKILLYHVIPGQYFFRNLTSGPTLATSLLGQSVTFDLTGGVFTVNGANISDPDNLASNGIDDRHRLGAFCRRTCAAALRRLNQRAEPTAEPTPEATPVAGGAHVRVAEFLAECELGRYDTWALLAEQANCRLATVSAWKDVSPGSYEIDRDGEWQRIDRQHQRENRRERLGDGRGDGFGCVGQAARDARWSKTSRRSLTEMLA